eukprot:gene35782-45805_t
MQCVQQLDGHESSVVSLRFSPIRGLLASAGKDRSLCIHADIRPQRPAGAAEEEAAFELVFQQKNAHKRIIWDCSWSSNETLLATVGRDGACKIWTSRYSYSPEVTGESSLGCAPYSWTQLITFSSEDGAALTT